MAITHAIFATWRNPPAAFRRQMAGGVREDRALIYLMAGCFVVFVSTLPALSRAAYEDPSIPLDARIGGALLAWMFFAPLLFYGLAALSHLLARVLGGRGDWFGARLALFWTLLAVSPVWLLQGLVAGFIGPGPTLSLVSSVLAVAFLAIWLLSLREAETIDRQHAPGKTNE